MDKRSLTVRHWFMTLLLTLCFTSSNGRDSSVKHRMFTDTMRKFIAYQQPSPSVAAAELAQSTVVPTYMRELFFRYRNSDVAVGSTAANTVRSINAEIGRFFLLL